MRAWIVRSMMLAGLGALAGCVSLAGRYDPAIEASLNSYHTAAIAFIGKAEAAAGTPAGLSSSSDSITFYTEQGAALDNLAIRAEVADEGKPCELPNLKLLATQAPAIPAGGQATPVSAKAGCTVIVIRHLQAVHTALQTLHKKLGSLRPPVSTDMKSFIDDAVRIALTNEAHKK